MWYRPEIDGLRAIAVGSVVLAHAGVGALAGGFVGVDVFFVISGYLITSLMLAEHTQGKFSLSTFYYRRARRILPALFVVLAACLPFGWWMMAPIEFSAFVRSMAAASVFLSNAYFWEKVGYFATSSELLPLLHTWSLAVEEQYYLLFPLLFLGVKRLASRALPLVLAGLIILSAGLAHWGAINKPDVNFFFSFSRFWEILVGALAAYLPALSPKRWHDGPTLAGLGMIVAAVVGFSASTPTPSLPTFLPVIGTALVLIFGAHRGWGHRVLTLAPMIGLGAISYSVYLWHQPVFAFARLYFVTGVPAMVMAGLFVLVLALAWLSWRFVEQPFRRLPVFSKRVVFLMAALGIAGFLALGLWLEKAEFTASRFTTEQQRLLNFADAYRAKTMQNEVGRYLTRCFGEGRGKGRPDVTSCLQAGPDAPMIWGDSHAQALAAGALQLGLRPGLVAFAGCPPVLGPMHAVVGDDCVIFNADMQAELEHISSTHLLVLHANWMLAVEGRRRKFYSSAELMAALSATLSEIRKRQPEMNVLLVGGVPQWGTSGLPSYLYRSGLLLDGLHRVEPPDQETIQKLNNRLREVAKEHGIAFLDPFGVLCNAEGCLATVESEGEIMPTAWDYGHLTASGASVLMTEILQAYSGKP